LSNGFTGRVHGDRDGRPERFPGRSSTALSRRLLNDNQAHAPLYENLLINPGDSLRLDLKARFNDDFIKTYADADLPIAKTSLYFTILLEQWQRARRSGRLVLPAGLCRR
jgi:hypothetical protein